MFDLEGCGQERLGRERVERRIRENLTANGWEDRCEAVAIEPELKSWVWGESLHVASMLNWERRRLKDWLVEKSLLKSADAVKPARPKEAFREAMRAAKKQLSSSVFQELAGSADITGCTDAAFGKFRSTLQLRFPPL